MSRAPASPRRVTHALRRNPSQQSTAKEVVTVPIEKVAKIAIERDNDIVQVLIENREAPVTVRITEQFRAPVIAAATECMVRQSIGHRVGGTGR
jgi:hypothetical protein